MIKEAMKQIIAEIDALPEGLEGYFSDAFADNLATFREALKQEHGEPHGWYIDGYGAVIGSKEPKSVRVGEWLPWYTTPQPAQKPLTDEQILRLLSRIDECAVRLPRGLREFAKAIEAAHGIKEKT